MSNIIVIITQKHQVFGKKSKIPVHKNTQYLGRKGQVLIENNILFFLEVLDNTLSTSGPICPIALLYLIQILRTEVIAWMIYCYNE